MRDYRAILAAQAVALIGSAVSLPLVTAALGPARFGVAALGLVGAQVLASFGFLWSHTGTLRLAQTEVARRGTLGATAVARLLVSIVVLVAGGGIAWLSWLFAWPAADAGLAGWMAALLVAWLAADMALFGLRALGRFNGFALVSVGRSVALVAGAVGLAAALIPPEPGAVLAIEAASYALIAIGAGWLMPRAVWRASEDVIAAVRDVVRPAGPLLGLQVAGYLLNGVDLFVIGHFLGHGAVGEYQVAYRVMQIIAQGAMGSMPVLFYVLMTAKLEAREAAIVGYLVRRVPQMAVAWGTLMIGVAAASGPVFAFAFAASYAETLAAFRLLMIGLVFQLLMVAHSDLIFIHDRLRALCVLHVAMLALNAAGDWWLVPRLGIVGAAWATAATLAVGGLGYWALAGHSAGVRCGRVFFPLGVAAFCCLAIALAPGKGVPVGVAVAGWVGMVLASRRCAIFQRADLVALDGLELPDSSRRALQRLGALLMPRGL